MGSHRASSLTMGLTGVNRGNTCSLSIFLSKSGSNFRLSGEKREMLGEKATELIKDLTRNKTDLVPTYRQDLVDGVHEEMAILFEQNQKDVDATQADDGRELLAGIQVRHSSLLWDKRCLLAYHHERLMRLKKLRWELGSVLPSDIVCNLSEAEVAWFAKYCTNLGEYMSGLNEGKGMDLTLYKKPPKRLYIQVRCLADYGDYQLEDGTSVVLTKDSSHYLPLSQCEKLIQQGVLEQITS